MIKNRSEESHSGYCNGLENRNPSRDSWVRVPPPPPSFAKATEWLRHQENMHYTYILLSSKSHIFYFGSTNNLKLRLELHNGGEVKSTKPHIPWQLVWYGAFQTEKQARDFELYLKTGSGKSFAYKRFVSVALAKDLEGGRKGIPKRKYLFS